ncbi:MAG: GDYXXLXY domain-containing protein [Pedobacter sp.]|nr:GDYXXLXY domain-containing protein [Pedobacter sp.]
MSKTKGIIILINLTLFLAYINWSIFNKEQILSKGRLILLELIPFDPRSIMQGDYMRLDYAANRIDYTVKLLKRGYCILEVDSKGRAKRVRFQKNLEPLKSNELAIKYYSNGQGYNRNVNLGAESYFFEEGRGHNFAEAKYGGLRVDESGNSVLAGLFDSSLKQIK